MGKRNMLFDLVKSAMMTDKMLKENNNFRDKSNLNSVVQNLGINALILEEEIMLYAKDLGYDVEEE